MLQLANYRGGFDLFTSAIVTWGVSEADSKRSLHSETNKKLYEFSLQKAKTL